MKYPVFLALLGAVIPAALARADDSTALQAMLNGCYAGTRSCIVDLQGATKVLTRTLRVNPELVTIRNAILECRMTSGTCLYVSQDGFPHHDWATTNRLEGITLRGNKSIDGITMNYTGNNNYLSLMHI